MKKLLVFAVMLAMLISVMALPAYAAIDASTLEAPNDITDDIKWTTLYDMYAEQLPIVRDDAVHVPATEYDMGVAGTAASTGMRIIKLSDWAEKGMKSYFSNDYDLGDGDFCFDTTIWANVTVNDNWDDRAKLVYNFRVEETGTYELVFLGCAQIKADVVDNDAKDRGFAFSVDEGKLSQVNISDTRGIFREYKYTYSGAELTEKMENITNGVNSYFFEPTYFYGITVDLTAGSHTLEFYDLFYSGETRMTGNGSRLNFMGFYVQKYLTDAELANYKYAEVTTAETTTAAPKDTTTAAPKDTTTAAPKDTTTAAPKDTTTAAPKDTTTEAPKKSGGCGSVMGMAALMAVIPAAVVLKKKKD